MRAMLLSFVAIAVIGVGAHYALEEAGFTTEEQTTSPNVRLD